MKSCDSRTTCAIASSSAGEYTADFGGVVPKMAFVAGRNGMNTAVASTAPARQPLVKMAKSKRSPREGKPDCSFICSGFASEVRSDPYSESSDVVVTG